ncbi:Hypothetical protein PENO1_039230 [Penicillium occitanis (nom. inval.)]|nr:Hypothetical protein PENO1_039230 [Penicillium occitanis (nom. inval.)]PCH03120.1 hypothetical protein PENOC_040130 [Penicillium occitanis (nom. inval.)]
MADQTEPVHFFDIKCTLEGPRQSWSPNTLKTRAVLNIKGILYTQSWISYPDIAPLCAGLGIPAVPDDSSSPPILYTLPAIIHKPSITSNPNGAMHDSLPIALHLDKAFPSPQYPSVFPHGQTSIALALATEKLFHNVVAKCATLLFPAVADILDDRGAAYFEKTRLPRWQRRHPNLTLTKMADLKPKTEAEIDKMIEETKKALLFFDELLAGGGENKGPFLEGEKPGFADVMLAAHMAWIERPLPEFFARIIDAGNGSIRKHWEASQGFLNGQGETKEWPVAAKI